MRAPALALLALALLAPPAAAQAHEHGAMSTVVIAHDGPVSGHAYVGGLAGFAVLDLGEDAVPDFHQQNRIRVTLEDRVLFETTPDSGHDYDGVNTFAVAFPATGHYKVEALDEGGASFAVLEGDVAAPRDPVAATLAADVPATATALAPTRMAFQLQAPGGALLPHTDALVEVWQGSSLLWRSHLHTHTVPMEATYAFPAAGDYTVRAVGYQAYPDGTVPEFPPVTLERPVQVLPGVPAPAVPPALPADAPTEDNLVVEGTASTARYAILGTYDPYTRVGPDTQQRLAVLVMDGRRPLQHVDFTAMLSGPQGTVWESTSLHEYDGVLETVARQAVPGLYRLEVTAKAPGWTGAIVLPYLVLPASESSAAAPLEGSPDAGGVQVYDLAAGDLRAGVAGTFAITAHDLAGNPFPHSEVDLQVLDGRGAPALLAKLHTHEDGKSSAAVGLAEGAYTVRLAPSVLGATPGHVFFGKEVGGGLDFPLQVAEGPGFAVPLLSPAQDEGRQGAPGAAAPLFGLLFLGLAAARRR